MDCLQLMLIDSTEKGEGRISIASWKYSRAVKILTFIQIMGFVLFKKPTFKGRGL